jgi:hypothetical protein
MPALDYWDDDPMRFSPRTVKNIDGASTGHGSRTETGGWQ